MTVSLWQFLACLAVVTVLSDEELEALLAIFQDRMDEVNQRYLEMIGQHLADIGKLKPTDLHRLKEIRRMSDNLADLEKEIARVSGRNARDVQRVIEEAAISSYGDYDAYGLGKITSNAAVMRLVRAQAKQTALDMLNLSNTTVVSSRYKLAIDKAVSAVQSGIVDYKSAVRSTLREVSNDGLRVTYESGLTRRLDTAVRQNILDATKQINSAIADEVGDQFGADGVEISAHLDCAEDHLPYQGKQMTREEFDRLQETLRRPIGEWNCRHFAFPIIIGISSPAHTDAHLASLKVQTTEPITIDGITKTRYQWTQEQRKLETKARYAKNEANMFKASGDDAGRRLAQGKLNSIDAVYAKITKETGLPSRRERMAVAGFKRVKAFDQMPDAVRYKAADFSSQHALDRHFSKHSAKYGGITPVEYVEKAEKLLRATPTTDILRCVREDGSVSKYRISTNEYVAGTLDGKIRTAFLPKNGLEYWKEELARNG